LNRWKNYYTQPLNVCRVSDVRQTQLHIAKEVVPEPRPFDAETPIARLKKYKSPGSDQIPAELIQVKHYGLRSINSLILFGVKKNCLISGRSLLLY
jgi:hypothetical protein